MKIVAHDVWSETHLEPIIYCLDFGNSKILSGYCKLLL